MKKKWGIALLVSAMVLCAGCGLTGGQGKTAAETARLLRLSPSAVNLYASNAMTKLRARTKTQAVAIAVRNDLLG